MRIILHIGRGKTGTTSIQDSLSASSEVLAEGGVKYLGLMLEHAPVHVAAWQRQDLAPNTAMNKLRKLDHETASQQIYHALDVNIATLEGEGVNTAIWSNERFFGMHREFSSALKKIASQGHEIQVVAYVRRHDSWAKSVHNQWYIKRKRNKGGNLSFKEFIEGYDIAFAPSLVGWESVFGEDLIVRNFDASNDVVADFCEAIDVDQALVRQSRSNDTPGPEETMLRALLGDRLRHWSPGEVDMDAFERLFRPSMIDFASDPVKMANDLLPDEGDLQRVVEMTADDRRQVDELLIARGQPVLNIEPKSVRPLEVDGRIVDSVLFQILAYQARNMQKVSREIAQLRQRVAAVDDLRAELEQLRAKVQSMSAE